MGRLATITAVRPPARFGVLESSNGLVTHFGEKNQADSGWINGGFFVLEPKIAELSCDENTSFESELLPKLVASTQLSAYHHEGFWQPMDTLRERNILAELARNASLPWINRG
jgi:glucose-1-phosphate cytidylyltransferase